MVRVELLTKENFDENSLDTQEHKQSRRYIVKIMPNIPL